ncbi:MAG TPA: DUF1634 domain-containing protein [Candidatus Acidoferrales bacterium]|nr:DUF1634 domain-containing protein [Candidatus Acidoferrales bacterium]
MSESKNRWTDERMDRIISVLLRTGVILSSIVVLMGGIWYLMQSWRLSPDYRVFRGEPASLNGLVAITRGLFSRHGRNWIQFGLVLLVATPVARVGFCVFAFFRERDWTYVVLTLLVLSVLVFSFVGR